MSKESPKPRNDRVPVRIRAEFIQKKTVPATTINVSRNGAFITDSTPDRIVNSVARVRLYLPPKQEAVEVFGRIAWKGKKHNQDGVGLHFMNMDTDARKKWVDFISEIEKIEATFSSIPELPPQNMITGEQIPPPPKQKKGKSGTSFMVRFKSMDRLDQFIKENIEKGEMFLKTPVLKAVGEKVQVVLVHPNADLDFELAAEVSYLVEEPTEQAAKGMGLKFLAIDEEVLSKVKNFKDA